MANKKLEMTPIMALSVMAMFALMIPLFALVNSKGLVKASKAARPKPTPSWTSYPVPTPNSFYSY